MDLAAICLDPALPGSGVLLAEDTRLVVEMTWPIESEPALWDTALWDEDVWGGDLQWVDVTCWVRELATQRGRNSPSDRYRVGTMTMVLDNVDRRWSTLAPPLDGPYIVGGLSLLGAGTVMRCGALVADDWHPWFTGAAESWEETPDFGANDNAVVVTVVETLADLATVDDLALVTPIGTGDSADERLDRLLTAAFWRWPTRLDVSTIDMQSTDLSTNRLAECYLVADSTPGDFYSDADGAARFDSETWEPGVSLATISTSCDHPSPAAWVLADDTTRITNRAAIGNAGGTPVAVADTGSVSRFGPFTVRHLDLIHVNPANSTVIANKIVERSAWDHRRIDGLTVDASTHPDLPEVMATVKLRDVITLEYETLATLNHTVESIDQNVSFADGPPIWQTRWSTARRDPPTS